MNSLIISSAEYRHMVTVAKHINEIADDVHDKDQKKKFLMRNYPPSVETLKKHHVREKFDYFFPYLLYYHEPDLCSFLLDTEEIGEMKSFINGLFKEILVVEEELRSDIYFIDSDEYDEMLEHNVDVCGRYLPMLTPYEKSVYCSNYPITLERLQSTDPGKNIDRFLPFLVRFSEPDLKYLRKDKFGEDEAYVKQYLRDCMFKFLDFK